MAVLLDLPQELLVRVASYLTTAELGPFRRICKPVEKAFFTTFAKEFFTKRQFMMEHVSLQALVDIANHKTLAPYLQEVIIGTQQLVLDPDMAGPATRYHDCGYIGRDILSVTGQAHAMLVEAFSKLLNLRTIGLRDYDAAGRLRDGDNARWKSYGWSFDDLTPAVRWGDLRHQVVPPGPLFGAVIFALGMAHANIEGVEVFLRRHHQLTPASFNIVQGSMGDAINPVLMGLKTLMLAIRMANGCDGSGAIFGDPRTAYIEADDHATKSLKKFLRKTPNLSALRLNFDGSQFYGQRLIEWLGRPCSSSTDPLLVPPVGLPSLACLDLGMVRVFPLTLVKVITKFKTLKSVNLWKVTLTHLQISDANHMTMFLTKLSETLPSSCGITHFFIGHASTSELQNTPQNSGPCANQVYFAADGNTDNGARSNRLDQITYKAHFGSDIKDWLQKWSTNAFEDDKISMSELIGSHEEVEDEDVSVIQIDDDEENEDEDESDG